MTEEEYKEIKQQRLSADHYLQLIVSMVNSNMFNIDINLQTKGLLVSGVLISGGAYFEELSKQMSDAFLSYSEEQREEVFRLLNQFGDIYRESPEDEISEYDRSFPSYIHLKDVTIWVPNHRNTWNNVLWRGRIAEVDGFFLGRPS